MGIALIHQLLDGGSSRTCSRRLDLPGLLQVRPCRISGKSPRALTRQAPSFVVMTDGPIGLGCRQQGIGRRIDLGDTFKQCGRFGGLAILLKQRHEIHRHETIVGARGEKATQHGLRLDRFPGPGEPHRLLTPFGGRLSVDIRAHHAGCNDGDEHHDAKSPDASQSGSTLARYARDQSEPAVENAVRFQKHSQQRSLTQIVAQMCAQKVSSIEHRGYRHQFAADHLSRGEEVRLTIHPSMRTRTRILLQVRMERHMMPLMKHHAGYDNLVASVHQCATRAVEGAPFRLLLASIGCIRESLSIHPRKIFAEIVFESGQIRSVSGF